ncbi:hypothetical protein ACGFZJ_31045, partial [Streptomyces sp. NPDC048253]
MTKKTRIRFARIAAGAVIAAGASLTVAGVASADDDALVDTSTVATVDTQTEDDPPLCDLFPTNPECTDPGTSEGTSSGTSEGTSSGTSEGTSSG